MPRTSQQRTNARKEEIVNACAELYETMGFKEITLKEIGKATSFTRTSIYNYFQTKEEIFLALLQREYDLWNADLHALCDGHAAMSAETFADALARSLEKREFKRSYGESIRAVTRCVEKFFPDMTVGAVQDFIYTFFPFMFGIYPYTFVSDKQRGAMERAHANYVFQSLYELVCGCVKNLLQNRQEG